MDKAGAKSNVASAAVGVSIRNGPVIDDKMDIDKPATNGVAKRKARSSTSRAVNYNLDTSDGDSDDAPLVCQDFGHIFLYSKLCHRMKTAKSHCAHNIIG